MHTHTLSQTQSVQNAVDRLITYDLSPEAITFVQQLLEEGERVLDIVVGLGAPGPQHSIHADIDTMVITNERLIALTPDTDAEHIQELPLGTISELGLHLNAGLGRITVSAGNQHRTLSHIDADDALRFINTAETATSIRVRRTGADTPAGDKPVKTDVAGKTQVSQLTSKFAKMDMRIAAAMTLVILLALFTAAIVVIGTRGTFATGSQASSPLAGEWGQQSTIMTTSVDGRPNDDAFRHGYAEMISRELHSRGLADDASTALTPEILLVEVPSRPEISEPDAIRLSADLAILLVERDEVMHNPTHDVEVSVRFDETQRIDVVFTRKDQRFVQTKH